MLKILLASAGKSLSRNKVHTLINVLSLTAGLTVFALLFLYVKHELTWDRSWPNADNVHRLVIDQNLPTGASGSFNSTSLTVLDQLRNYFPGVYDKGTRLMIDFGEFDTGDHVIPRLPITLVDPEFADIFLVDVVAGDLRATLQSPGLIAVEESLAAEHLGDSPLGQTLTYQSNRGGEMAVSVGAVFRAPPHITNAFNFRVLAPLHDTTLTAILPEDQRQFTSGQIWVTFNSTTDIEAFHQQLPGFLDERFPSARYQIPPGEPASDFVQYRFQPLTDIHLNPVSAERGGDIARIVTFALVGILVLLVGCSNAISLSLASVLERRREIGIRKAIGAQNSDIVRQYLGETFLLTLPALGLALLLMHLLTPAFSGILSLQEPLAPGSGDYRLLAGIALLTGLASGAYPALVMAKVRPEAALKVNYYQGVTGTMMLRKSLVGIQFAFALLLLIATLGLYKQLEVTRNQPMAFNPDNLVMVFIDNTIANRNMAVLADELSSIPGVKDAVLLTAVPNRNATFQSIQSTMSVVRSTETQNVVPIEFSFQVGYGVFEFLEIPVLAGRTFDPAREKARSAPQEGQADNRANNRIILNRRAVTALGFDTTDSAVGQTVFFRGRPPNGQVAHSPLEIIGVVEDHMYRSLKRRPPPEMYRLMTFDPYFLTLRYDDAIAATVEQSVRQVWEEVTGTPPASFIFIEDILAQAFIQEESESRILLIAAGLAVFLSSIGLYGLAAFTMERNTKEVGVRKVLGASVGSVTGLFLWRFSKPLLIANVVAWPAAVYFILQWIERFPYQLDKAWLLPLCVGGTVLVVVIALITVGSLTVKAASANPVESLRYE